MMPDTYDGDLLRPIDVAREYRIGRDQVRRLVRDGELLHYRNGPRILIPRWAFLRWVNDRLSGPHDDLPTP